MRDIFEIVKLIAGIIYWKTIAVYRMVFGTHLYRLSLRLRLIGLTQEQAEALLREEIWKRLEEMRRANPEAANEFIKEERINKYL